MKKNIYILILLTLGSSIYSQNKDDEKSLIAFERELQKHLYPPLESCEFKERFLFIAYPFPAPEYSLRLLEIGNYSLLEVRILNQNLGKDLSSYGHPGMKLMVDSFV